LITTTPRVGTLIVMKKKSRAPAKSAKATPPRPRVVIDFDEANAITDELVEAVVDNLRDEHEAWIAVFNRRVAKLGVK